MLHPPLRLSWAANRRVGGLKVEIFELEAFPAERFWLWLVFWGLSWGMAGAPIITRRRRVVLAGRRPASFLLLTKILCGRRPFPIALVSARQDAAQGRPVVPAGAEQG